LWRAVLLALMNFMAMMRVIGYEASSCANAGSGHGTNRASNLSANKGATYCTSGYKLGLGVVAMVVGTGLCDGIFVGFLRVRGDGKRENSGCEKVCGKAD
jgi:hypothetical protein